MCRGSCIKCDVLERHAVQITTFGAVTPRLLGAYARQPCFVCTPLFGTLCFGRLPG